MMFRLVTGFSVSKFKSRLRVMFLVNRSRVSWSCVSWSLLAQVLEMTGSLMMSSRSWFWWSVMRSYHGLLVMSSSSDVWRGRMMHWFFCHNFLHGSGSLMHWGSMMYWICMVNRRSLMDWSGFMGSGSLMMDRSSLVNWGGMMSWSSNMGSLVVNWGSLMNRGSLMNWGVMVNRGSLVNWCSNMGSRSLMMYWCWLFGSFLFK